MAVGQIARPVPFVIQHLPQNHVGFRADIVVKNSIHSPFRHIAEFSHTGVSPWCIARPMQAALKYALIAGALHENLSPNVAVQPLSPATDRRLGRPLPHQLTNQTQGHLLADCSFPFCIMQCLRYMRY